MLCCRTTLYRVRLLQLMICIYIYAFCISSVEIKLSSYNSRIMSHQSICYTKENLNIWWKEAELLNGLVSSLETCHWRPHSLDRYEDEFYFIYICEQSFHVFKYCGFVVIRIQNVGTKYKCWTKWIFTSNYVGTCSRFV